MTSETLETLEKRLFESKDVGSRRMAALAIPDVLTDSAKIRKALVSIKQCMEEEQDPGVRIAALQALCSITEREPNLFQHAQGLLEDTKVEDDDKNVRRIAAQRLNDLTRACVTEMDGDAVSTDLPGQTFAVAASSIASG